MKFSVPKCPDCGEIPIYIVEELIAQAGLAEPDKNGVQEYEGASKVIWDSQSPMEASLNVGEPEYYIGCDNGHEWQTRMEE